MSRSQVRTTRLAPSPTGALHLGNARTFLVNWAMARRNGWRIVLRIEDLDGPRVKPEAAAEALDILRWLGLDWDGPPVDQTHDLTPYHRALMDLQHKGLLYPCRCTRREIEQAQSAPHADDHELRYPGTCRGESSEFRVPSSFTDTASQRETRNPELGTQNFSTAWRVTVPEEPITFRDELHGEQTVDVQQQIGDFVVATKNGLPSYQLAVVVDDARQGVTDVVRADDLLGSTARQLWLYRALELGEPPRYWHLPLVLGPDGRRLAKRHGDTRLTTYREQGVSAERVIGLLAYWSGVDDARHPCSAAEFAERFDLDRLPRTPITFTAEDDAWLTA